MKSVNKTLYIPLYGKAYVSKKGIILHDKKAEEIWKTESFELKGKSKSKWLAYYMAMRAEVFDSWLKEKIKDSPDTVVIHLGCGLDSRNERVGAENIWFDIDFPEVIQEREKHYEESDSYRMIGADIRDFGSLTAIPNKRRAVAVIEGVSMYLKPDELADLFSDMANKFEEIFILADFYTEFAAKASAYKNPINDMGVTEVYGMNDPEALGRRTGTDFVKEHEMTPETYINELKGVERLIFKKVFGGRFAKKLYRLYEFTTVIK